MARFVIGCFLAGIVGLASGQNQEEMKEFDKYGVAASRKTRNAPITVARIAPGETLNVYVDRLKSAAGMEPNFAGKYSMVLWSCGFVCVGGAIVNVETRDLYWLPFITAGECANTPGPLLGFKPDSRLLIVRGQLGLRAQASDEYAESGCGVYRFVWTGREFKQILK